MFWHKQTTLLIFSQIQNQGFLSIIHLIGEYTSKEYTNIIYGNPGNTNASNSNHISTITPIAIALPASLNGASFGVLSESLPFQVSLNNYLDSNKNQLRLAGLVLITLLIYL